MIRRRVGDFGISVAKLQSFDCFIRIAFVILIAGSSRQKWTVKDATTGTSEQDRGNPRITVWFAVILRTIVRPEYTTTLNFELSTIEQ